MECEINVNFTFELGYGNMSIVVKVLIRDVRHDAATLNILLFNAVLTLFKPTVIFMLLLSSCQTMAKHGSI